MPDRGRLADIYLQPGELYFGDRRVRLRTLLGSCVSLVFWHAGRRIGGMNHFMLPSRTRPAGAALDGRYGDEAVALLLQAIQASGTRVQDYRVHLVGGGDMFPRLGRQPDGSVGERNVEAARRLLAEHGLQCHGEHVGGSGHRNLIFDICSGQVAVRQLLPAQSPGTASGARTNEKH